ncbi:hypothetical protein [Mumia zhuanghuii]|uniref:hypothetical protein n=1 Tax=Mumia zhuanghuii TaxID=2585211 RepID=UPI00129C9CE9|nr:hypothetical protein [Mumia zhuanghuii]
MFVKVRVATVARTFRVTAGARRIQGKPAYDPPSDDDGMRVLVDLIPEGAQGHP